MDHKRMLELAGLPAQELITEGTSSEAEEAFRLIRVQLAKIEAKLDEIQVNHKGTDAADLAGKLKVSLNTMRQSARRAE